MCTDFLAAWVKRARRLQKSTLGQPARIRRHAAAAACLQHRRARHAVYARIDRSLARPPRAAACMVMDDAWVTAMRPRAETCGGARHATVAG